MDYEVLFEELMNSREKFSNNLAKETVDHLSNGMNSAWDKKVVKYVFASTRSRTELEN